MVKFDVQSMHKKPQVAAQTRMVDDGSGQVKVRKCSRQIVLLEFTENPDKTEIHGNP